MYKTELHCHTSPISNCAHVSPEETVEQYIENGYTTLVITNHLSPTYYRAVLPESITETYDIEEYFLSDYRRAKKQAGDRLNVLFALELRVKENMNDYLIYGVTEDFVHTLGNVMDKKIKDIVPVIHENGGLIFQAHPFRDTMTVTSPRLIDGVEVINLSKHLDRNEFAELWAHKYGLLKVYGSDYHDKNYMKGGGILTDTPITTEKELYNVLKSQNFSFTDGENIINP